MIGLPLPDVDCRIVSLEDEKTVLSPGEIGELVLRGPQVMKGYHNMPLETKNVLRAVGFILVILHEWMQMGISFLSIVKKS